MPPVDQNQAVLRPEPGLRREGTPRSPFTVGAGALNARSSEAIRRHVRRNTIRIITLVVGDLLALAVTRALGRAVASAWPTGWIGVVRGWVPSVVRAGWELPLALMLALVFFGTYGRGDRRRSPRRILSAVFTAGLLVLWASLWIQSPFLVLRHYVGLVAVVGATLVIERLVVDWFVVRAHRASRVTERVVFVGDVKNPSSIGIFKRLVRNGGMDPIGWSLVRDGEDGGGIAISSVNDFALTLQRAHADTVVLCGDLPTGVYSTAVEGAAVAGCRVLAVSRYSGVGHVRPSLVWESGVPFFEISVPALRAQQMIIKRMIDVCLGTVGSLFAVPLGAVLAVAIKVDSSGPIFFVQDRVGRDGRPFRVYKFRTMFDNVPDQVHRDWVTHQMKPSDDRPLETYKLAQDPRVTRVGRFLRATSLDELPQFINVLRGEMSLVGPRPPLLYEVEAYEPWQMERLCATPGITGLWQVSGRSRLSYRRMCELDVEYVKRWSIWLDLKILMKTIPVVLLNSGRAA